MTTQNDEGVLVYIGTYTHGRSEGIYVYRMDVFTGALQFVSEATGVDSPSFLALHPQQHYILCG